jgi:integrase
VALAPTELTPDQRYVLKTLVERADSPRLTAIFALGYWAALRISEVAQLQIDHCVLNQRAGTITLVGSKGGKTRTLDLHNQARRARCGASRTSGHNSRPRLPPPNGR